MKIRFKSTIQVNYTAVYRFCLEKVNIIVLQASLRLQYHGVSYATDFENLLATSRTC